MLFRSTPQEVAQLARNQQRTAAGGREPGLTLERGGQALSLVQWAGEVIEQCLPIARAVDAAQGGESYTLALRDAQTVLSDLKQAPSARVLHAITHEFDRSYTRFIRTHSSTTKASLLALPYAPQQDAHFKALAQESIAAQRRAEAADTLSFEDYRLQYLATERLLV